MLCIDFGTSRTKVAWRDESGEVRVISLEGESSWPSLCYRVPDTGELLWGKEAEEALEDDPANGAHLLKKRLMETGSIRIGAVELDGAQVLGDLFTRLRQQALRALDTRVDEVVLSYPATPNLAYRTLLSVAAEAAGFTTSMPISEPVAAARGYLLTQDQDSEVLVLDCGGGTVDWALVCREGQRIYLSDNTRAEALERGGSDVDEALVQAAIERAPEVHRGVFERRWAEQPIRLLQQVRRYKEALLGEEGSEPARAVRVGGRVLPLDRQTVEAVLEQSLMGSVVEALDRFVAAQQKPADEIPVLLTGGSSQGGPLRSLLAQAGYRCVAVEQPELAVACGALAVSGVRRVEAKEPPEFDPEPEEPAGENTPVWASDAGEDEYGRWAEFRLGPEQSPIPVAQRMRWIEPGTFWMGSASGEAGREDDELQHRVSLTRGYWLAETACTQALWEAVTRSNPSHFKGADRPVERVNWHDVRQFIDKLKDKLPGTGWRFPSEAEWEYAARAGSETPFWWGSSLTPAQANYNGNVPYADGKMGENRGETVPVTMFEPNPWGLYQVHGNVWEWCEDWYSEYESGPVVNPKGPESGEWRVFRGGGWNGDGRWLRAAFRFNDVPDIRSNYLGFRLCAGQPGAEPR